MYTEIRYSNILICVDNVVRISGQDEIHAWNRYKVNDILSINIFVKYKTYPESRMVLCSCTQELHLVS